MAIAKMERVHFIAPKGQRNKALRLIQSFQRVEIEQARLEEMGAGGAAKEELEWRELLQQIEKARNILSPRRKSSALAKLRTGRRIMSLSSLEAQVENGDWPDVAERTSALEETLQRGRSRRTELLRLAEQWRPWDTLTVHPRELSRLRYAAAAAGTMPDPAVSEFEEQYRQRLHSRGSTLSLSQREGKTAMLLLYPGIYEGAVKELSREYGFSGLDYPFDALPAEMLRRWEAEGAKLLDEEQRLLRELDELAEQAGQLDLAEDYYRNLLIREEAKKCFPESKTCFHLSGWVLAEDAAAFSGLLARELGEGAYYLSVSDLSPEDLRTAPVALKNNRVFRAFENLTEMYSMPSYDELDPTPFMAPFYLVFFGMMVADVGYGLVLLAATFIARKYLKPDRGLRKSLDFFFYLSFPVMVWGFVYGSIFGADLPFRLFSPTTDIIPILVLSIFFGWLQIMTALALGAYIHLRRGDVLGAMDGGFSWMGLLLSGALLVVSLLVLDNKPMFYASAALGGLSVLLIVLVPVLQNRKSPVKGLMKGLYALYGATGYIGDLVSYSRLMALGVAGGSIAVAFNTIINTLPVPFRLTLGILLAVALHALNLFLSFLGAYVHGIRLQYVEMFGKFYSGGGRKFSPFKAAEKHIYLTDTDTINMEE